MTVTGMDEYIEREAAYEDFEKCNSENPKWTPSRVKAFIARQKAANVAPVRHGRWRFCGSDRWNDVYECDNCGKMATNNSDFCPNCGAKMDLEV